MYPTTDLRRYLPFAVILLAYLAGMWIDVMEIDAAQYAGMSRTMLESGDYLQLWDHGKPYLDKPPLTFWMTALSYRLFGVATWSFKLPSVLFALLAVLGVERLASLLHNRRTGELAALIFASAQGVFLMNNDVKTDMYMIAPTVLAIWLLLRWQRGGRWWHWVLGGLCMGVGMLAKGPLAVVIPALAIGGDILLRRDWKALLRWEWLLLPLPVILVTLPWDIGQYQQYGWQGVRFFFWTQSFGRVTGQSEWENDATWFFFVHTFGWAFLPWSLLFIWALVGRTVRLVRDRFQVPKQGEAVAWAGFLLVFAALCTSRFKLPHYIFVTFPFAAILLADAWVHAADQGLQPRWRRFWAGFQYGVWILGAVAATALAWWAFPEQPRWPGAVFLVLAILLSIDILRSTSAWYRLVGPTALGFALINLLLNFTTYPAIMQYQSTAKAGQYLAAQGYEGQVHAFLRSGRALDFYAGREVKPIPDLKDFPPLLAQGAVVMYTNAEGYKAMDDLHIRYEVMQVLDQHAPNRLSLEFLNPATRPRSVGKAYLLRLPQQVVALAP